MTTYLTNSGKATADLTLRNIKRSQKRQAVVMLTVDHRQSDLEVIPKGTQATAQGFTRATGWLLFIGDQGDPVIRCVKPKNIELVRRL